MFTEIRKALALVSGMTVVLVGLGKAINSWSLQKVVQENRKKEKERKESIAKKCTEIEAWCRNELAIISQKAEKASQSLADINRIDRAGNRRANYKYDLLPNLESFCNRHLTALDSRKRHQPARYNRLKVVTAVQRDIVRILDVFEEIEQARIDTERAARPLMPLLLTDKSKEEPSE